MQGATLCDAPIFFRLSHTPSSASFGVCKAGKDSLLAGWTSLSSDASPPHPARCSSLSDFFVRAIYLAVVVAEGVELRGTEGADLELAQKELFERVCCAGISLGFDSASAPLLFTHSSLPDALLTMGLALPSALACLWRSVTHSADARHYLAATLAEMRHQPFQLEFLEVPLTSAPALAPHTYRWAAAEVCFALVAVYDGVYCPLVVAQRESASTASEARGYRFTPCGTFRFSSVYVDDAAQAVEGLLIVPSAARLVEFSAEDHTVRMMLPGAAAASQDGARHDCAAAQAVAATLPPVASPDVVMQDARAASPSAHGPSQSLVGILTSALGGAVTRAAEEDIARRIWAAAKECKFQCMN